jgi:hypothetical protein
VLQRFCLRRRGSGIGGGRSLAVAGWGGGRYCLSLIEQARDDGCKLVDARLFGRFAGVRAGTDVVSLVREESDMLGSVRRSCSWRSRV